jgi:pimeloyl-ACP methyl ester carboxylesterase
MHAQRGFSLFTFAIAATIVVAVALLSGVSYEQVERARDRERLPQAGRSVDIGGRTLNLFCSGAGQPTVIFESGAPWLSYAPRQMWEKGAPRPGYSWTAIQGETAKFTRACWYDRAGSGWSDFGPYPRTSTAQARDLHALLRAAEVGPPYLLVAESSAALDARVYTGLYSGEVAGLVFVDGVHPDLLIRMGRGQRARIRLFLAYSADVSSRIFDQLGLYRLAVQDRPAPVPTASRLTASEWNVIRRLSESSKAHAALMQEVASWDASTTEARAAGTLGERPLVVISSENPSLPHDVWADLQTDLSRLSTRGRRIETNGSGDLIYQSPDTIVRAVRQVVSEISATAAHSPDARLRP